MNSNTPSVDQLQELGLPSPVSYAPQTWGWWVLLGILIGVALLIAARRYVQWRRNRYRREALKQLAVLRSRSEELEALRELPQLLKRVALSMPAPGRGLRSTASAHTSDLPNGPEALGQSKWQIFLQQHSKQQLPDDFSAQLALLAYAPDMTLQVLPHQQREQLFDTCQHWVEQHHVAA